MPGVLSTGVVCLTCLVLTEFRAAFEFGVTTGALALRGILKCLRRLNKTW
jgi:hypothetical protein